MVIEAALCNRVLGLTKSAAGDVVAARDERGYLRRMEAVARATGRTLGAVRKRAERLGKRSYRRPEGHPLPGSAMTDDDIPKGPAGGAQGSDGGA